MEIEDSDDALAEFGSSLGPLSELIVAKLLERIRADPEILSDRRGERGIANEDLLALEDAAAKLQHSYSWLSRNYRKLGLRPSRVGRNLLFKGTDIDALVARQKVRFRGRPPVQRKGTFPPPQT